MIDREKVIYDIERCICHVPDACRDCSRYGHDGDLRCMEALMSDAIELLKEQDAVEPTIDEYGNKRCGSCGHKLQSIADPDLFCCKCGKLVKWE